MLTCVPEYAIINIEMQELVMYNCVDLRKWDAWKENRLMLKKL